MANAGADTPRHGNSYGIFILVLTVMSLVIMVLLVLPLSQATHDTLRVYDNLICVVFLVDFGVNLRGSHPRSAYFVHRRGWLDLLGSIPNLAVIPFVGLFRLARISRLERIMRMLSGQNRKLLINDVLRNRSQYALFITLMLVLLVLSTASVLILQFESVSPDANIKTGGDALWWSIVTLTTVGYGDRYPVTDLGRLTAISVMFAGIGVIGALASILASILVAPATDDAESPAVSPAPSVETALAETQAELVRTRAEMAELRRAIAGLHPGAVGGPAEDR